MFKQDGTIGRFVIITSTRDACEAGRLRMKFSLLFTQYCTNLAAIFFSAWPVECGVAKTF